MARLVSHWTRGLEAPRDPAMGLISRKHCGTRLRLEGPALQCSEGALAVTIARVPMLGKIAEAGFGGDGLA
eukprot:2554614-Alexandrium_andersonii.AAC.1